MAPNQLSGPAVTVWLVKWLMEKQRRRHTYRIVFIPETIGSITYLSRNLRQMKAATVAGFNLSCMGDERCFSYLPSRLGGTVADRVARHVLKHIAPDYIAYSFRDRGSDERQYCSPGVDLPVCSVMRSKFGNYPEYHTSLDDLSLVTPAGLAGSLRALQLCLECLENNETLTVTVLCEPQLGKRGLYPTISSRGHTGETVENMMHILAYSDGNHDLLAIAEDLGVPLWTLLKTVEKLKVNGLLAQA
jgi:aminopeptidase-like protein